MKLNRMTASFGKLDNASLELGSGLNVITAPNESGKSTWASFLKAMLYGIDTKDRDKKGYLADKNRFQPWSGKPMMGEISLTWGGRDITLRRSPKGSTPFATFSATHTGTDTPVSGLTATDCGFSLTGVEREVYLRSAFLGAGSHAVTAAPELERRIAALVTTGLEEFSFSQVEGQLKEWGRLRRVNKSVGLIPRLEGELAEVEATLSLLEQLNDKVSTAAAQRVALSTQLAQLDEELRHHQQWENQRKNQKYTAAKEELDRAEEQLSRLHQQSDRYGNLPSQERLRHWQGELAVIKSIEKELKEGEPALQEGESALEDAQTAGKDAHFDGLLPTDALELAQRETATYESHQQRLKQLSPRPLLLWGVALVAAAALAFCTVHFSLIPAVPLCGGAVIGSLLVGGLIATARGKKAATAQMDTILQRYAIQTIQALTPLAEDYVRRQQAIESAETALRHLKEQRRQQRDRADSLQTRILEFVQSFSAQVQGLVGCSAAISRALQLGEQLAIAETKLAGARRLFQSMDEEGGQLASAALVDKPPREAHQIAAQRGAVDDELRRVSDRLSQLQGRQLASGDPAALASQREQLTAELARRNREVVAIQTALEVLYAANIRLQERFSPQLNAKAGEYLTYLTEGKYEGLSLNRELEGAVTQTGDLLPHSALTLSRGTADQLYFAVRLAVCDLCLPQEESVPLVLDDALVAFDQQRMERALDLLCKLAERKQILLFSCHRREADYLRNRTGVTLVDL